MYFRICVSLHKEYVKTKSYQSEKIYHNIIFHLFGVFDDFSFSTKGSIHVISVGNTDGNIPSTLKPEKDSPQPYATAVSIYETSEILQQPYGNLVIKHTVVEQRIYSVRKTNTLNISNTNKYVSKQLRVSFFLFILFFLFFQSCTCYEFRK